MFNTGTNLKDSTYVISQGSFSSIRVFPPTSRLQRGIDRIGRSFGNIRWFKSSTARFEFFYPFHSEIIFKSFNALEIVPPTKDLFNRRHN